MVRPADDDLDYTQVPLPPLTPEYVPNPKTTSPATILQSYPNEEAARLDFWTEARTAQQEFYRLIGNHPQYTINSSAQVFKNGGGKKETRSTAGLSFEEIDALEAEGWEQNSSGSVLTRSGGGDTAADLSTDATAKQIQNAWLRWKAAEDTLTNSSLLPSKGWGVDGTGGTGSGSGGSGGGGGAAVKVPTVGQVEDAKQDEVSRQFSDALARAKGYYALLDSENGMRADEAARLKASNAMSDSARDQYLKSQKAIAAGDLDYYEGTYAPSWSDPLNHLKVEMPKRPLSDMFYEGVPEYVLPDYRANASVGLAGPQGFDDQDFGGEGSSAPDWYEGEDGLIYIGGKGYRPEEVFGSNFSPSYAKGTDLPRFAGGTLSAEDVRIMTRTQRDYYNSTGQIPPGFIAYYTPGIGIYAGGNGGSASNTGAANAGNLTLTGGASGWNQYRPSTQPGPGRIPLNQVLPADQRVADTAGHVTRIVNDMISNILSGRGGYPPGYTGPKWDQYIGVGRDQVPAGFTAGLTDWVRGNLSNAGIQQIWGAPPTQQTIYIDDPSTSAPGGSSNAGSVGRSATGGAMPSGGMTRTSSYDPGSAGALDPNVSAQLEWEREKWRWQQEIDRWEQTFREKQFASDEEYRRAQAALEAARFEFQKAEAGADRLYQEWQKTMQERGFTADETEREWQRTYNTARFDWEKEKETYDRAYQDWQKDFQERGFTAEEADREWNRKFQQEGFDWQKEYQQQQIGLDREKFDYQKEADAEERNIQRGKITADYGASGTNDAVARQFFVNGQADPVGEAIDIFTGESRGRKTLSQIMEEDAPLYQANQRAPKLAGGTVPGYTTEPQFIVGDDPSSKPKWTGYEEVMQLLLTPDGKPAARVINNKQARQQGLVGPKGKKLSEVMQR